MTKRFLLILLLSTPIFTFAQTQENSYFSLTVGGGLAGATTTSESSNMAVPMLRQTYMQYNDSVQSFQSTRLNFSATLWYHHIINSEFTLQTGLGYIDMGWRREQNNLKYGDFTYPGVGDGRIIENSNTTKNINYDYRFHYLQIPVWINYLAFKSKDFKTTYSFTGGLTGNVLLKHALTAKLDGFTLDSKSKFQLDSTGYDARTFNMQFNIGLRVEHKLEKNITAIIQPMYSIHPFSATNEPISAKLYGMMLNIGVVLSLDMFDE